MKQRGSQSPQKGRNGLSMRIELLLVLLCSLNSAKSSECSRGIDGMNRQAIQATLKWSLDLGFDGSAAFVANATSDYDVWASIHTRNFLSVPLKRAAICADTGAISRRAYPTSEVLPASSSAFASVATETHHGAAGAMTYRVIIPIGHGELENLLILWYYNNSIKGRASMSSLKVWIIIYFKHY